VRPHRPGDAEPILRALDGGARPPAAMTPEDYERAEREAIQEESAPARARQPTPKPAPVALVDQLLPIVYADELAKKLEPFRWLCRDLAMMRGRPLILSGYGDAGKTFAAQEMLLAVATGRTKAWGGLTVDLQGDAVHIDFEQQLELTRWRYQRLAFGMGIDLAELGPRLGVVSLPPLYLPDPRAEDLIAERCQGKAICLIDNLTAGTPGIDENSKAMAGPLYMLNRVSSRTGTTILVIHHEGKTGEAPRAASQRIRGHSSIHGALGGGVSFSKQPDGCIQIEQAKQSLGEAAPAFFRFEDRGELDPNTGKREGIELTWLPPEEAAQAAGAPMADTGALRRIKAAVLAVLGAQGAMSKRALRESLSGGSDLKARAIEQLAKEGKVRVVEGGRGLPTTIDLAP
jgi:hypothetical protein